MTTTGPANEPKVEKQQSTSFPPPPKEKVEKDEETEDLFNEYDPQEPSLRLFEIAHLLDQSVEIVPQGERDLLVIEAKKLIVENNIIFYFKHFFSQNANYTEIEEQMKKNIEEKYAEFLTKIDTAEEAGSDQDILDIKIQRVKYCCQILENFDILDEFFQEILKLTSSNTVRIDLYFALSKYSISRKDLTQFNTYIEQLDKIVENDGDWDHRNRYNVYKTIFYLLSGNNFTAANPLLLNSIQTFSSTDIIPVDDAMLLAVYIGIIRCKRKELNEKIIESPEIIQSLLLPRFNLQSQFLNYFYSCQYSKFYSLLPQIYNQLLRSPYLSQSASLYLKEARLVSYKQYLSSFQLVKIDAFAASFGVSNQFIEQDVSNLISAGRLDAKIDLVQNVIKVVHSTNKMSQFVDVVNQADGIVSKINTLTQRAKAL